MKKFLSIALAGTMAASMLAVSAMSVSADELAPGDFGSLGEYTPGANVKTNHLMFAMPGAWQNDTTKNEKCGQAAGIYWWEGPYNGKDYQGDLENAWPGYAVTETVEGQPNIYVAKVPVTAGKFIWNNLVDGGTDKTKPIYTAAIQSMDIQHEYYDPNEDGGAA